MKNIVLVVSLLLLVACGNKKEGENHSTNEGTSQTETTGNDETTDKGTEAETNEGSADSDKKELSVSSVAGSWKLIGYEKTGSDFELKDCDKTTVWNFTEDKDEPLGDGTEVYKLVVTKDDACEKWFAFESKWTVHNGQMFIASTRIGGMGGVSHAGLFKSASLEGDKMILKAQKATITFQKAN